MYFFGNSAHVFHVAKTGNDANAGNSFATAKLTITAAIGAASDGDTIIIWPGTYNEALLGSGKVLNVEGAHYHQSIISGPVESELKSGSTLKNLTITGDGLQLTTKDAIRISDCRIISTTSTVGLWIDVDCSNFIVERCYVQSDRDAGSIYDMVGGIFKENIYYTDSSGASVGGRSVGHVITSSAIGSMVFDNCTFQADRSVYATGDSHGAESLSDEMNVVYKNCTFKATQSDGSTTGDALGFYNNGARVTFINCNFEAIAMNGTGGAYGLRVNDANSKVVCENCTFSASSENGTEFDIEVLAGSLTLSNCEYNTVNVTGTGQLTEVGADTIHTWYVTKTGNDNNYGHSFGNALLTITQARTSCAAGDTIIIQPGTYDEAVDFTTGSKKVNIAGKHRALSLISKAGGVPLTLDDQCIVENLAVSSSGGYHNGIVGTGKEKIVIKHCNPHGVNAGIDIIGAKDILIKDCISSGDNDGMNARNVERLAAKFCSFSSDGTYSTTAMARGVIGSGRAVYSNCNFEGTRTDVASGAAIGFAAFWVEASYIVFLNCVFKGSQGNAGASGDAHGLRVEHVDSQITCINCVFKATNAGGGEEYDIKVVDGSLNLLNCSYATSSGNIKNDCADALTNVQLDEFAKILSRSVN